MAIGYETNTAHDYDPSGQPADITARTLEYANKEIAEAHGIHTFELWKAHDGFPEHVLLTEETPAGLILDYVTLVYTQAETFAATIYDSPVKSYLDHIGVSAEYTGRFEGGSTVAMTYPDLDTLNMRSAELDGAEAGDLPLQFVYSPEHDYKLEDFLGNLSQGIVIVAEDEPLRAHDVFFHAPAWISLPPALRTVIFAHAGKVLADYQAIKDVYDPSNESHRTTAAIAQSYMRSIDTNISNANGGIMRGIVSDIDKFSDRPSDEYSELGNTIRSLIGTTDANLATNDMRQQMLTRVRSAMNA